MINVIEDPIKRKLVHLSLELEEKALFYQKGKYLEYLFVDKKINNKEMLAIYFFLKDTIEKPNARYYGITPVTKAISNQVKKDKEENQLRKARIPTTNSKLFSIVKELENKGLIAKYPLKSIDNKRRTWNKEAFAPCKSNLLEENQGLTNEVKERILNSIINPKQGLEPSKDAIEERAKLSYEELRQLCFKHLRHLDFHFYTDFSALLRIEDLQEELKERIEAIK